MAELKARHAFGQLEQVDQAILDGKVDSYDVLFLKDANGKPYIGWVDKQGNKVICNEDLDIEFDTLESEIAKKASTEEVEARLDATVLDVIDMANAYTDEQINLKIAEVESGIEIVEF